jgi:hypothetical protein
MKQYVKPTLDAIELRLEERVARCYDDPNPAGIITNPGNHPGNKEHCPAGS